MSSPAGHDRNQDSIWSQPFCDIKIMQGRNGSLSSFLYILPNEFLGILFEDLVNFIQQRVDVLGHFLVAFGDLGVDRGLDLVGVLARARRLLLPAGVPGGHGMPSGPW